MMLDGDWVGIWKGSSPAEIRWFAAHYFGFTTVVVIVLISCLIFASIKVVCKARWFKVTKQSLMLAVFSAMLLCYSTSVISAKGKIFEKIAVIHLISNTLDKYDEYSELAKMKMNPDLPRGISMDASFDKVIGVFVLGESAARSRWGLYGYDRDTTPNMSRRASEIIAFDNLVTPIGCTAEAMRYIFTTRTVEKPRDLRYTLPQALRSAGYEVSLLSNQERWGEWDGDETFDFAGCEPMHFIGEMNEADRYDEVLLKYIGEVLPKGTTKRIVFLHLQGSHPPTPSKYPHERAPFPCEVFARSSEESDPVLTQNHYDNSIWYTDRVLEQTVKFLEARGGESWMMYLSDHGESVDSKSWRLGTDRSLWDVPFIVWTSKEYKDRHSDVVGKLEKSKHKRLQSDQLFYGLLSFAGLENIGIDKEADFLNPEFKERSSRVIHGGKEKYKWE